MQVRLDRYFGYVDVLLEGIAAEDVDRLPHEVGYVVYVLVGHVLVRQFDSYDDVGAHLLGYVGRIVVAHAAVHEDLAVGPDGSEYARYGHGGAQGGVELAFVPEKGLAGNHFRGYAEIRDGECGEVDIVLITYRQPAEDVVDVMAEYVS